MCNFKFECYHDAGLTIFLKVDNKVVKCKNNSTISTADLILINGDHEITVCKNLFLYKWYWWINIFNLFYVFKQLKNRTGGCLGYDDHFASCTINFSVNNDDHTIFKIDLISKNYNKKGRQGSYFLWDNIIGQKINIKNIKVNKMNKYLIRRWRMAKGFPIPFYCVLTYIALTIKIINGELVFDIETFIYILFSVAYSSYTLISTLKEKCTEENIGASKKQITPNIYN